MENVFKNIVWLFYEKFLTVIGTLLVTIYTARYLGPENMGIFDFSIAIASTIVPLSQLGSQSYLFDKIAKNKEKGIRLLLATQPLRKYIYYFFTIIIMLYYYFDGMEIQSLFVLLGILISYYFSAIDSYRTYFDATLKSKINALSTNAGVFISQAFRLIQVQLGSGYVYFVFPYILNTIIPYLLKYYKFEKENKIEVSEKFLNKTKKTTIKILLPVALSGFCMVIYVKANQIIIGNVLGTYEVGVYSAAATLSQACLFIPLTIMTVMMRNAAKASKDKSVNYSIVLYICTFISLFFAIILTVNSRFIINISYGTEYLEAYESFMYMSAASVFVVVGTITNRYIINTGGYTFLFYKVIISCCINITITLILIESMGISGAALSILIVEILTSTLINYFYRKGVVFKMHFELFLSPKILFRKFRSGIFR